MTTTAQSLETPDSAGKRVATQRLTTIIEKGVAQQTDIIQKMLSVTIVDKLVDPRVTVIEQQADGNITMRYRSNVELKEDEIVTISNHALGQMCSIAKIPKTYVNALISECVGMGSELRLHLICYLFNTHFHEGLFLDKKNNRTKFLHRIMRGELWGFLSRNYNRKLGTVAMLKPFIEECYLQGAKPVEAYASPLQAVLKCVLPIIYEPVPGEFVAFGATYTNSDFGSGSLLVRSVLLRISSGASMVLEAKLRKIHLGAVIQDQEIELSEETLKKESETHALAVRDMVKDVFSAANIERSLKMVEYSITHKVPWNQLADKMKDVLSQSDVTSMEEMLKSTQSGIIDLPPVTLNANGDPEANAWWAAAALGVIAGRTEDVDKKASIQELAGKLLKKEQ